MRNNPMIPDFLTIAVAIGPALLTYAGTAALQALGCDLAPWLAPERVAWEAAKWVAGAEITAVGVVLFVGGLYGEVRKCGM